MSLPSHVSFSQLGMYARCGEAYRRQYVVGADRDNNLPAAVGSAFHSAAEEQERRRMTEGGDLPTVDGLYAVAQRHLRAVPGLHDLRYYGRQDVAFWFKTGLRQICLNYLTWRAEENVQIADVEVKVNVTLPSGIEMLGYIDQVLFDSQGRRVLRDIKTGAQKDEHHVQGELYRLAWELLYPDKPVAYTAMLYLKGKVPVHVVSTPTLSLAGADAMLRSARSGVYPPSGPFTGACNTCQFAPSCEFGQIGKVGVLL